MTDSALSCGDHRFRDLAPQTSPTLRSWIAEGRLVVCLHFACSSASYSRARLPPTFWLSARHLSVVLSPPPPQQQMCTPLVFYQHLFSLHHPLTQPHFTQPPVTQPVLCSVHPTPRHHTCYAPTMSHSKPCSPLTPIITPTLHDHPRTNLVPWKIAINQSARAVFAEWDRFGFLFGVCDDTVWAVLNAPPGGILRTRQDFPAPADLATGAGPAARDAFKCATKARLAWLACSAAFYAAILDSIGESNRLAISDPDTDTLHLSPRDIINAMTALHGTMTGTEVDALRLPLKKKLPSLAELPAHIVTFRGHLARLTTAGQAPLAFDA